MQPQFESLSIGSTIRTIGVPELRGLRIPLPSLEDQAAIVEAAATLDVPLREGIETAARGIRLAQERRAALISAAVTGKIGVGVAA
jgi:type I restriction enzyme S subunit